MTEPTRPRHRMVDRVAAILELVARSRDGLTLTDIAHQLDFPLSTTQGLVNGLTAAGYLDERTKKYTLGMAPYLINVMAGRRPIDVVSQAEIDAIFAETGLITVLSIAVDGRVFYLHHAAEGMTYEYLTENFLPRSLLRTSSGWVLLANMERRDLWTYLKSRPAEDAPYVTEFLNAAEEIATTGICASPAVAEKNVDGVSIAVEQNGHAVAAVGVIGSGTEIAARRDELVDVLKRHRANWQARG
ncbi:IclR family transcriptional regulator [Corynebacterium ulceribovis]|uniref:IclR family transcriptional regulator n=1 Tax=Corynebacterium ulceribovis TaxID=487732 RepID=UPI00038036EC|nr:helix-turn-helix domain-containing protein [Corynebacterium ulceribovis]